MQQEKVIEFLIKAKKATYAGKGPKTKSSRPKSRDLIYSEDNLKYIDTYLGTLKFAGEEAIWEDEKPFWSMNYCGRVLKGGFEGDFLKEALYNVPIELPYRGPHEYKRGGLTYNCSVEGSFDWFLGNEAIYNGEEKVYECRFHGGFIV
jgi:hypothetical protein